MRELTINEIGFVAGAGDECSGDSGDSSGNDYAGIKDPGAVGDDLVAIYEGLVQAASHIIERVANAL